jgi:phospholipid transport system substrate-binding protein
MRPPSATRYADNFDGYDDQRFETRSEKPAARGTILVMTELVQPKDENVSFDYRLRRTTEGWRIIDVQLDGVISELTLRRAQYRSVIEHEGFERLVKVIESKIEEISGE